MIDPAYIAAAVVATPTAVVLWQQNQRARQHRQDQGIPDDAAPVIVTLTIEAPADPGETDRVYRVLHRAAGQAVERLDEMGIDLPEVRIDRRPS